MAHCSVLFVLFVLNFVQSGYSEEKCYSYSVGEQYECINGKCYCTNGYIPDYHHSTCVKCRKLLTRYEYKYLKIYCSLGEKCFGPSCGALGNETLQCWHGVYGSHGNWICSDSMEQMLLVSGSQIVMAVALVLAIVATFTLLYKLCAVSHLRFIVLEDCGHVMEFETLEKLMKVQSDVVKMQCCPNCRAPIINTPRYKDLVNRKLAEDINPIKERVYGNEERITARRKELHETVAGFHIIHNGIYTDKLFLHWKKAFEQIILVVKSKKKYSLSQLEMYFVYLNILELLSDVHKKYTAMGLTELQENLIDQNKMICQVLAKNVNKLSEQQQADIGNEIKRMNAIVSLAVIINHHTYHDSKNFLKVIETENAAKTIILKWGIYEHDKATEALNEFQKEILVGSFVKKEERKLYIKAIRANIMRDSCTFGNYR